MNGITEKIPNLIDKNENFTASTSKLAKNDANSATKTMEEPQRSFSAPPERPDSTKTMEIASKSGQNSEKSKEKAQKWWSKSSKASRRRKRRLSLMISPSDEEDPLAIKHSRCSSDVENGPGSRDQQNNFRPDDPIVSPAVFRHHHRKRKSNDHHRRSWDSIDEQEKRTGTQPPVSYSDSESVNKKLTEVNKSKIIQKSAADERPNDPIVSPAVFHGWRNSYRKQRKMSRASQEKHQKPVFSDDSESAVNKKLTEVTKSTNDQAQHVAAKDERPNDPIVSPVVFHHHRNRHGKRKRSRDSEEITTAVNKKLTEVTKTGEEMSADSTKILPVAEKPVEQKPVQEKKETGMFNPKSQNFRYGNYNRYYGKRIPKDGETVDPRFRFLKREWFCGKTVLDVGCNVGLVTLHVAKRFKPRLITGIDIDQHLVGIARKNVKHYVDSGGNRDSTSDTDDDIDSDGEVVKKKKKSKIARILPNTEQPSSSNMNEGSALPPIFQFPQNILFKCADYVPANDHVLEMVQPEYDVILAFSITKWIHLNWGDNGLKRFFKRIYKNLNPGGILLLEPQSIPSYQKRKRLTPEIFETFKSIKFFPDQFNSYLLSEEVGFESVKTVGVPKHKSKGFARPIFMFKKRNEETKTSTDMAIEKSE